MHVRKKSGFSGALRVAALLILVQTLAGCGGGGGGGGGGQLATARGRVLRAETNQPASGATVTIGDAQTQTDATGRFALNNAPAGATAVTVALQGAQPLSLTVPALPVGQDTNLGDLFLSNTGYNATVNGRIVTFVSNQTQPVGNATVVLGGAQTKSGTDGRFTLTNLPVGLGNVPGTTVGQVVATGFETKPITAENLGIPLVAGNNSIGDLVLGQPVGSKPPPGPYTIKGSVTVQGKPTAGVRIQLASGGTNLGETASDSDGNYYFWVVPAAYRVTASGSGVQPKQANVTLVRLDTPVFVPNIDLTP